MSTFDFDQDAVTAAATTVRDAATGISLGPPADASGCGSASVRTAVDDLRFWSVMSSQLIVGQLGTRSGDADAAVAAYAQLDAETASAAGGTP